VIRRVLFAIALVTASLTVQAAPDFAREGPVDPAGRVEIENASGEVEVSTWDLPQYRLEAHSDDGIARVDVSETKGVVNVRVVPRGGRPSSRDAKLHLRIPAGSALHVQTLDARIAVYGLAGPARLDSASGLIEVVAARGPADIRSISGAVRFTGSGVPNTLRIESMSGRVDVRNAAGAVEAQSIVGAVDVRMALADRVHVQAFQGRAQLDARLAPQADVVVESFGGAVQARLVAEAGYHYDVGTRGGAFLTCFGRPDGGQTGTVGAGVASVRLRSFGGAIRLCDS
jgi:hypothetical protein